MPVDLSLRSKLTARSHALPQGLAEWLALGHVDRVAIWMLFLAWAASVVQVHWMSWQARASGVRPVSGESGAGMRVCSIHPHAHTSCSSTSYEQLRLCP